MTPSDKTITLLDNTLMAGLVRVCEKHLHSFSDNAHIPYEEFSGSGGDMPGVPASVLMQVLWSSAVLVGLWQKRMKNIGWENERLVEIVSLGVAYGQRLAEGSQEVDRVDPRSAAFKAGTGYN